MDTITLAKLFNGGIEYRDEVSDFQLKELFRTLKANNVPKQKRKDKALDVLVKIEELAERPTFKVSKDMKQHLMQRLEKLLTDKGSKYRDDWEDITKEKLQQFEVNPKLWPRILEKIAGKTKRKVSSDKKEKPAVKKYWVPTRCRVGQEKYRGREIARVANYPSNSTLKVIEFVGGGNVIGSTSEITSDPNLIASKMRSYNYGDIQTVVIRADKPIPGTIPFESMLQIEQYEQIMDEINNDA